MGELPELPELKTIGFCPRLPASIFDWLSTTVFSVSFGVVGVPRVTGVVVGVFGDCGDGVGSG